jgi:hypothetical protein
VAVETGPFLHAPRVGELVVGARGKPVYLRRGPGGDGPRPQRYVWHGRQAAPRTPGRDPGRHQEAGENAIDVANAVMRACGSCAAP